MNLFWYKSHNFGDMLSPYMLSRLRGVDINSIHYCPHDSAEVKYILTGSLLSCPDIRNAVIFGAGFVYSNNYFTGSNILIKGIRGKLSLGKIEAQINQHGNYGITIDPDVVIAEPSLALPHYYKPNLPKTFKLGIIPHLFDYRRAMELYQQDDVAIIDIGQNPYSTLPETIHRVINEISLCERTISSSLHGLIVSAAYGIPTDWCRINNGSLIGDDFKFYDFIDTIDSIFEGNGFIKPIDLTENKIPVASLLDRHRKLTNRKIDIADIINSGF